MLNNCLSRQNILGKGVLTIFKHISPLKAHTRAFKLTCKVGYFRYCDGRIGGLLEIR